MKPTHHFEPADGRLYVAHDYRDGLYYTTVEHVYWGGAKDGSNVRVMIPKGTPTDMASVPWPFSLIVPRAGRHNYAAALHDQLYKTQALERDVADSLFRSIMRCHGVNFFARNYLWLGVRLGGWHYWNRQAKRNAAAKAGKEPDEC